MHTDDRSARLADRLNLALCREDVELARRVAPSQPLRRLYRRLCHHPGMWFLPPGIDTVLLLTPLFFPREFFNLGSFPNILLTLCLWPVLSALVGIPLNLLFWPVHLALWQGLEGCCWLVDTLLIDPLTRFFNIGDTG